MTAVFNYSKLLERIAYQFNDEQLLHSALTHRSVLGQNNERMEFLGDSILNFIIGEALYQQFPHAKEGQLTRLRSALVKGETLADIAMEFEIGNYLNLGPGEMKSGGHRRRSILADSVEAIIAGIYLDSDIETCKKCVLAWYEKRLDEKYLASLFKDPKTRLQEYLQSRQLPLPNYDVVETTGKPHEQVFTVACSVDDLNLTVDAKASTRRQAEQLAAEKILVQIQEKG